MAQLNFKGNPIHTNGDLPAVGSKAPAFTLVKNDLSRTTLADYAGKKVILNIFPSVDTGVCATSVRKFNEEASNLENTVVICVSKDLPFAFGRFCGAEGIQNVVAASDFDGDTFGTNYQVKMTDGPLTGLLARAVVAINENGEVVYTELVDDIVNEPNYEGAIAAL